MLTPGQTIDRYELIRRIGEGGMAHVWAARPQAPSAPAPGLQLVALKILHSRFAEDPSFRAMFLDEARIVSSIEHRNVARVFELGEKQSLLYLAMEYVDGESLFSLLAPQRTVPVPIALKIAAEAAAGVHAVHELVDAHGQSLRVVHRDVSPHNILLSTSGDVKLIDFGIAHARDRAAATTDVSVVKGKARYMAPEQARREALGPFTDVFGIGATLFRMITGRAPYAMENDVQTMQALIANAPATSSLPADLHEDVRAVITRAIAPNVRDRFATAKELHDALAALVAREYLPPDIGKFVASNMTNEARARHVELMGTPRVDLPLPTGPDAVMTSRPPALASGAPAVIDTSVLGGQLRTAPMPARDPIPNLVVPPQAPAQERPTDSIIESLHDQQEALRFEHERRLDDEERARSFMDVGALAAQARAVMQSSPDHVPGKGGSKEAQPRPGAQKKSQLELAVPTRAERERAARPGFNTAKAIKIAIAATVVIGIVIGVMLLAPRLARERAISTAREAGILLKVGRTGVGFDGVTFRDVKIEAIRLPMTATADEITSSLSGSEMRILGLDMRLKGKPADIQVALASFLADNRSRFAGSPSSPRHIAIVSSRMTWSDLRGEGSELSAGDIGVEIDSRGIGSEEVKGTLGRFDIKVPAEGAPHAASDPPGSDKKTTVFGPWSGSFERSPGSARARLLFDPNRLDGPSFLVVWTKAGQGQTEITMKIPRTPFKSLGVSPVDFGLPTDDRSEIDMNMHGKFPAVQGNAELKGEILLANIRPRTLRGPVDIRLDVSAAGPVGKPLEFDKTTASLGPFVAFVNGTIQPSDHGVRVDATFRTIPMACSKVAAAEAKTWGPLAATLQALGQTTGALRVTGNVNASGTVKYDSESPEDAHIDWLTKETCGVSIFGL